MREHQICRVVLAIAALVFCSNQGRADEFAAKLSGFNELGAQNNETGAILTDGTGKVSLRVGGSSAQYRLTYSGLGSAVQQAHIHFGKVHSTGGVMVFFCTNLGNGPVGTPACPTTSGTVSGTWTAASVVAISKQNVKAGDFQELLDALNSDTTYANVHTANFPAGEIRGQVQHGEEE